MNADARAPVTGSIAPEQQLRILHVAETAQGGVGSYLEEVVPLQLRRYGSGQVRAVLPVEHARHFPRLTSNCLAAFPLLCGSRATSALRMARYALDEVRRWQPDVVHLHSTLAGVLMRPLLATRNPSLSVLYCAHGWAFDRQTGPLQARTIAAAERFLSRCCDRIVCVSEHELARARELGIPVDRLRLVRSGIRDVPPSTEDSAADWPAGALRVLFVGRLDRQKGIDVFYSAMSHLGAQAFGVVVGARVADAGRDAHNPPSNVSLRGWCSRDDIDRLYASADVLVVPSRWEALGLVALEAMRAGLPVVASRVGGLTEVVEDGRTGRLIEPDNPRLLAEVLGGLDRAALRLMGARARECFLQRFQVERVVEELHAAYCSAPAARAQGSRAISPAGWRRP